MDLGLEGRVALVTGGSKGIGRGDRRGARGRGRAVAIASRSRRAVDAARASSARQGYVFDSDDLDAVPAARRRGDRPRPDRHLRRQHRRPAAAPDPLGFTREQWEAAHRTLVLSPMAFLGACSRGCASAAGAAWSRSLDRGARADRRAPALQRPPPRPGRRVQGARARVRGRRRDAQHPPPRPDRHRPRGRHRRLARGGRGGGPRRSRPAGSATRGDRRRRRVPLLEQAAYITGTTLLVDGGADAQRLLVQPLRPVDPRVLLIAP